MNVLIVGVLEKPWRYDQVYKLIERSIIVPIFQKELFQSIPKLLLIYIILLTYQSLYKNIIGKILQLFIVISTNFLFHRNEYEDSSNFLIH